MFRQIFQTPVLLCALVAMVLGVMPVPAAAFWVVNFGPADTLAPGKIGFAAGMGGQVVSVGEPRKTSAFFTIPHAGFRVGLARGFDAGLRLAPVPLPYSTVGPGFGANVDVKALLTPHGSPIGIAAILGAGGAHVLVQNTHRLAWSPNVAALFTLNISHATQVTTMARYVYLSFPTANGGWTQNFVHIGGASLGLKMALAPRISFTPEVGAYWYEGALAGHRTSGPGVQFGAMLGTAF